VPARWRRPLLRGRLAKLFLLVVAAAPLGGCYHGSARDVSLGELSREPGWATVEGVPLIRQSADKDCGAAALAMVLARWRIPSSDAEIVHAIPTESGHGIAAGALRDYARTKGLQAFLISGEVADLVREVGSQRPVMVGLVQHYGDRAFSHYEVVVGINERARRVLLLDPARGRREDSFDGFSAEWGRAGRLTLVVASPEGVPGPASGP
jgi:ABC-type bacteriocin/lantibiotic exporter with double-glycine peptidase domain